MQEFVWEAHNWSKGDRLWLGAFTLLPVAVGIAIPIRALLQAEPLFGGTGFCVLCLAHPLMVFMLLTAYAPAAFNNHRISKGSRILWLIGFVTARAPVPTRLRAAGHGGWGSYGGLEGPRIERSAAERGFWEAPRGSASATAPR
jgi:hypothetical protein